MSFFFLIPVRDRRAVVIDQYIWPVLCRCLSVCSHLLPTIALKSLAQFWYNITRGMFALTFSNLKKYSQSRKINWLLPSGVNTTLVSDPGPSMTTMPFKGWNTWHLEGKALGCVRQDRVAAQACYLWPEIFLYTGVASPGMKERDSTCKFQWVMETTIDKPKSSISPETACVTLSWPELLDQTYYCSVACWLKDLFSRDESWASDSIVVGYSKRENEVLPAATVIGMVLDIWCN